MNIKYFPPPVHHDQQFPDAGDQVYISIDGMNRNPGRLLAARIARGKIPEAMKYAGQKWREIFPNHPFVYSFLDEEFENIYRRDLNTGEAVNLFSFLAIFIACLGLFSLASHSIEQRTKEIGVRKVLGAPIKLIAWMLVSDFVRLVLISNLIAWPLAWFASKKWLESFAYRIDIEIWAFLLSAFIALVVAMLTVSYHSIRAARSNPVDSLKYE